MGLNIFLFKNKVSVVGVFFCPYAKKKKRRKEKTPPPKKKLALKVTCSIIQQQLKLVFIIVKK